MKARGGFTFIELLLAGAILSTIAFGALVGMLRIGGFVDRRGELMAADGFCWDVAWRLFNDQETLQSLLDGQIEGYGRAPNSANAYFEVKGAVGTADGRHTFLNGLQNPVCYITLSNRYDAANASWLQNEYYDDAGVFIHVNLEWGPPGQRRILTERADSAANGVTTIFEHPITLFCGKYAKRQVGQ